MMDFWSPAACSQHGGSIHWYRDSLPTHSTDIICLNPFASNRWMWQTTQCCLDGYTVKQNKLYGCITIQSKMDKLLEWSLARWEVQIWEWCWNFYSLSGKCDQWVSVKCNLRWGGESWCQITPCNSVKWFWTALAINQGNCWLALWVERYFLLLGNLKLISFFLIQGAGLAVMGQTLVVQCVAGTISYYCLLRDTGSV